MDTVSHPRYVHQPAAPAAPALLPLLPVSVERQAGAGAVPHVVGEDALNQATISTILERLESSDRRVLIVGEAGYGKTFSLSIVLNHLATEAARDRSAPIPVMMPAADLDLQDIDGSVTSFMSREYGLDIDLASKWLAEGRVFVLLDGIEYLTARPKNLELLSSWLSSRPGVGVVATCLGSKAASVQRSGMWQSCWKLLKPNKTDVEEALAAAPHLAGLLKAWQRSGTLRASLSSPLALALAAKAYVNISARLPGVTRKIPLTVLLDEYIEVALAQAAELPGRRSRDAFRTGLVWLALSMQRADAQSFRVEDIQLSWLPDRARNLAMTITSLMASLTRVILLLLGIATTLLIAPQQVVPDDVLVYVLATMAAGSIGDSLWRNFRPDTDLFISQRFSLTTSVHYFVARFPIYAGVLLLVAWVFPDYIRTISSGPMITSIDEPRALALVAAGLWAFISAVQNGLRGAPVTKDRRLRIRATGLTVLVVTSTAFALARPLSLTVIGPLGVPIAALFSSAMFERSGGKALIRHLSLRIALARWRIFSIRSHDFLRDCCSAGLMRAEGTHHVFAHGLLQKRLAAVALPSSGGSAPGAAGSDGELELANP